METTSTTASELAEPTLQTVAPTLQGGDLFSVLISTVIVVAVILFIGWLYSRSKFVKAGANDAINIVAMRALGPKERLFVVDVANQQLLIGMTSTAVQTLHVFDTPVIVDKQQPANKSASNFAEKLRGLMPDGGQ